MSNRRKPGEIVRRRPGAGFCGAVEPQKIKVPEGKAYEFDCVKGPDGAWQVNAGGEAICCIICDDRHCREWANLEVVSPDFDGVVLHHISECEMYDE